MKSWIVRNVPEFPKLMKMNSCGCVVLFINNSKGFVVKSDFDVIDDYMYEVGHESDEWEISQFVFLTEL